MLSVNFNRNSINVRKKNTSKYSFNGLATLVRGNFITLTFLIAFEHGYKNLDCLMAEGGCYI